MSAIKIRRGLDVPIHGAAVNRTPLERRDVRQVALLPAQESRGIKARALVEEGARVRAGQPVLVDRRDEGVLYTAPVSGILKTIQRGERRIVQNLVFQVEGQDFEPFQAPDRLRASAAEVRAALMRSGFWPCLRQRPFDKVALSSGTPGAVFVTGTDSAPLAPRPFDLVAGREAGFRAGLEVLARLLEPAGGGERGPLYLCVPPGENWSPFVAGGAELRTFAGPHPSGNVGTHIHFLYPVGPNRSAWHIDAQSVADIGDLWLTGKTPTDRLVAITGPAAKAPKLVRTRRGASTLELLQGEIQAQQVRVVAGSALDGVLAAPGSAGGYLGRFTNQLTLLEDQTQRELLTWALPIAKRFSATNLLFDKFFRKRFNFDTDENGSLRALVPVGQYESVMPLDILPTQLIKALASGDTDTAIKLGVLELAEADLALCQFVDSSKQPLTEWLRNTLTAIEKED
jgi:Na+-transporting NADH:ubiquinone oxidoreductase subunit A